MGDSSGMEDVVVPGPDEVPRRLAEMGLPADLLRESVRRGYLAGDFVTSSHPVFYKGTRVYSETNGALREALAGLGWSFRDNDNIPCAVSPDGAIVITALRGNERTGIHDASVHPQTYRPRRSASIRIIQRNAQLEWSEVLPADEDNELEAGVPFGPTWFLLYHRMNDKIRCELSLAEAVSETGTLLRWSERLILPEIDMLVPISAEVEPQEESAVDVPVERRAG